MPFNISIHFTYTFSHLTYTHHTFYIQRKISFCKWSGAISQSTQTQCYRLCYLERERERGERKKEMQSTAQIENELLKLNDKRWLANFKRDLLPVFGRFICLFVCLMLFFSVEISFSRGTNLRDILVYLFIQFYYRSVACLFIIIIFSSVDVGKLLALWFFQMCFQYTYFINTMHFTLANATQYGKNNG